MAQPTPTIPFNIATLYIEKPGKVALHEEPTRPLKDGEFFVETLYAGISAGTILTWFNGTNPKSSHGFDKNLRIFRADIEPDKIDIYPKMEGHMEVGRIIASRSRKAKVGTIVAIEYGPRTGYIAKDTQLFIPLPKNLDPILGIYVIKFGAVCLNGILHAADELHRKPIKHIKGSLKGQRVMIFGAGMVGLFCGMFAKWAGAREVAITDGIPERLEIARKLGMTPIEAKLDLPLEIKKHWREENPRNSGADIALQCTGSDFLLSQAFSCLRVKGTVIDLGYYQQGASQLFLGKEYHHNGLRLVCSQVGLVPDGQKAWNRKRLDEETIDFLQDYGDDIKKHLITHVIGFADVQEIFERLADRDHSILQVVINPKLLLKEHIDSALTHDKETQVP